jgi:hypothetical protein
MKRERACDEEVLRLFGEPEAYPAGILAVCKRYVEAPGMYFRRQRIEYQKKIGGNHEQPHWSSIEPYRKDSPCCRGDDRHYIADCRRFNFGATSRPVRWFATS